MDEVNLIFEQISQNFVKWANAQEDIRAAIIVGSRARTNPPPDEWSDLDIMIYAHQPEQYLENTQWLSEIGQVWIEFQSQTAGGEREILALFESGCNVDFVINPIERLQQIVENGRIPEGHWRGARILLDKDNLAEKTIPPAFRPPTRHLPSKDEFYWLVKAFWYTCHYTAKQIRRRDLWLVKIRDGNLKEATMQMLVWHTLAHQPEMDTWHMGRFYQHWADPRAVKAMNEIFGHFDVVDSWRALFATMELFSWVGRETAKQLNYSYQARIETLMMGLVQELYMDDPFYKKNN